jgi:2-hydroxy-6-oxonona-2,4-dienedioate hydrolase
MRVKMATAEEINRSEINVGGIPTTFYECGTGEPMILVHGDDYGRLSNALDWQFNFDNLSQHFRVIALDKLGMGFTGNPPSDDQYVIGGTVSHLRDFMSELDIRNAHLIGHSRGGYVVTRLAMEEPRLAKTITIVASGTLTGPPNAMYHPWEPNARKIKSQRDRIFYLKHENSYSDSHITDSWIDTAIEIENLEKTKIAANKMDTGGLLSRLIDDLGPTQRETRAMIRSGGIKCPVHIVWGHNDRAAPLAGPGVSTMKLIFPNVGACEMSILNQTGHYVFREQTDAFNERVTSFIDRHSERSPAVPD